MKKRDTMKAEVIREMAREQTKDHLVDGRLKHAGDKLTSRELSGLTCNEASVDTILSEGEST